MNILKAKARIAWATTLRRKKDTECKDIELSWHDYTRGFNVQPNHFDFDVLPRTRSNWPRRAGKPRSIQLVERAFLEERRLYFVPLITNYPQLPGLSC